MKKETRLQACLAEGQDTRNKKNSKKHKIQLAVGRTKLSESRNQKAVFYTDDQRLLSINQ